MPPAPSEPEGERPPAAPEAATAERPSSAAALEPVAPRLKERSGRRSSKRSPKPAEPAASTNGDDAGEAKDPTASGDGDGDGGSSREPREETSRAGDRSG